MPWKDESNVERMEMSIKSTVIGLADVKHIEMEDIQT